MSLTAKAKEVEKATKVAIVIVTTHCSLCFQLGYSYQDHSTKDCERCSLCHQQGHELYTCVESAVKDAVAKGWHHIENTKRLCKAQCIVIQKIDPDYLDWNGDDSSSDNPYWWASDDIMITMAILSKHAEKEFVDIVIPQKISDIEKFDDRYRVISYVHWDYSGPN